jgi:hypothetical protein
MEYGMQANASHPNKQTIGSSKFTVVCFSKQLHTGGLGHSTASLLGVLLATPAFECLCRLQAHNMKRKASLVFVPLCLDTGPQVVARLINDVFAMNRIQLRPPFAR